jgi:hypothetical protein
MARLLLHLPCTDCISVVLPAHRLPPPSRKYSLCYSNKGSVVQACLLLRCTDDETHKRKREWRVRRDKGEIVLLGASLHLIASHFPLAGWLLRPPSAPFVRLRPSVRDFDRRAKQATGPAAPNHSPLLWLLFAPLLPRAALLSWLWPFDPSGTLNQDAAVAVSGFGCFPSETLQTASCI